MDRVRTIMENVCLADKYKPTPGSGRTGTAFITLEGMGKKFGNPHALNFGENGIDGDGKVHAAWIIDTPRGPVEIGDYWWNPKDQQSIRGTGNKSTLWVINWLRLHGVCATIGNGK